MASTCLKIFVSSSSLYSHLKCLHFIFIFMQFMSHTEVYSLLMFLYIAYKPIIDFFISYMSEKLMLCSNEHGDLLLLYHPELSKDQVENKVIFSVSLMTIFISRLLHFLSRLQTLGTIKHENYGSFRGSRLKFK